MKENHCQAGYLARYFRTPCDKQGAPTQDLLTYKVNSLFNTETRWAKSCSIDQEVGFTGKPPKPRIRGDHILCSHHPTERPHITTAGHTLDVSISQGTCPLLLYILSMQARSWPCVWAMNIWASGPCSQCEYKCLLCRGLSDNAAPAICEKLDSGSWESRVESPSHTSQLLLGNRSS